MGFWGGAGGMSVHDRGGELKLAETVARISEDEFQVWHYGYRPTPGPHPGT
jgi:hypothetical protein